MLYVELLKKHTSNRSFRVSTFMCALSLTLFGVFQNCAPSENIADQTQSSQSPTPVPDSAGLAPTMAPPNPSGPAIWPGFQSDQGVISTDSRFLRINQPTPIMQEFYVSTNGSDANVGSEQSPFRTLEKARLATRAISSNMTGNIVIHVSSSSPYFYIGSALKFDARDSGTNGFFIIYRRKSTTPVTLTNGYYFVGGWILHNAASGLYKLHIGAIRSRQLFVGNVRRVRARSVLLKDLCKRVDDSPLFNCSQDLLSSAAQPSVEMVSLNQWRLFRCPSKMKSLSSFEVNANCAYLSDGPPEYKFKSMGLNLKDATWLENHFEFIDEPGEWFHDRISGFLYYKPLPTEDLSKVEIFLPGAETLFQADGLGHTAFIGFGLSHTGWLGPEEPVGFAGEQANNFYTEGNHFKSDRIPAAISCTNCSTVVIAYNNFARLGGSGVELGLKSKNNVIFSNTFNDISGGAIHIGIGESALGPSANDTSLQVRNNSVENNTIFFAGQEYFGSPAVFAGFTQSTQIVNNEVAYHPYTGISVGWGWTGGALPNLGSNVISGNLIHDVMTLMSDGGAIYTLSRQEKTQITNNVIRNVGPTITSFMSSYHAMGIYLDNGSSFITVSGNKISNVWDEPIWEQNIILPHATNNNIQVEP